MLILFDLWHGFFKCLCIMKQCILMGHTHTHTQSQKTAPPLTTVTNGWSVVKCLIYFFTKCSVSCPGEITYMPIIWLKTRSNQRQAEGQKYYRKDKPGESHSKSKNRHGHPKQFSHLLQLQVCFPYLIINSTFICPKTTLANWTITPHHQLQFTIAFTEL